jgi:serine/threonine protein kinase
LKIFWICFFSRLCVLLVINCRWLWMCQKTNSGMGPICWMAPESIAHRTYSKKSDVWSFGIVGLWILKFQHNIDFSLINLSLLFHWKNEFNLNSTNWKFDLFVLKCLFSLWNCCTTWTSQRWKCYWSCSFNSVSEWKSITWSQINKLWISLIWFDSLFFDWLNDS